MYVEVYGGLTSKLWVLATLYDITKFENVKIIWNKYDGIMAGFSDLFLNKFPIIQYNEVDTSDLEFFYHGTKYEVLSKVFNHPFLWLGKDIKLQDIKDLPENAYLIMDYGYEDDNFEPFRNFINTLVVTPEIASLIAEGYYQFTEYTYGVQIRGCQNTINYFPQSDNLEEVIIEKLKVLNNRNKILLVTGDISVQFRFSKLYSDRLISLSRYPLDHGYSPEGIKRALAEWYLLSCTNHAFIGKNNYAIRSCRYGNVRYEIL